LETMLEKRERQGGSVRLGHGVEAAYFSQQEMELDTRGSVLQCVQRATGLQRPDAQKLLGRFLFSGWAEHEKPVIALSGGERRRPGVGGGGWRSRSSSPRARTSSSSTSPRTISISKAAKPSRPRSRRSRGPCCSSPTTARCSTPSRSARWRSRIDS